MNWGDNGIEIRNFEKSVPRNTQYFFKEAVSWGKVATGRPSFRIRTRHFAFVDAAPSAFGENLGGLLASLNSCVVGEFLKIQGSTVNVTVGTAKNLPFIEDINSKISSECISYTKQDWDAFENSWDFQCTALLNEECHNPELETSYRNLRAVWLEMTNEVKRLEEENNRIFIEAYCLADELNDEIDHSAVTLTCNPHYRYGGGKSNSDLEALLSADTMREFISYAVGCMLGRYSLDKPGLILANQGESVDDYRRQIPNPTFVPDEDNVIPLLDGDWFTDDISERFKEFLKVTFGTEHYEENLSFLENALYPDNLTGKKRKTIRDYFLKEFYSHHVKLYKKRPIYWLFSSPKGSFNALIYMHRYRPDTVSVILNDYLREFRTKLESRLEHLMRIEASADASKSEKTKSLKEVERLRKIIDELETWERDVLYPLATQQIEIDLDDGVKSNYPKFGTALKKIAGLSK